MSQTWLKMIITFLTHQPNKNSKTISLIQTFLLFVLTTKHHERNPCASTTVCHKTPSFFHIPLTQNSTWSTKCYQSTLVIWTKDDVPIISFLNTLYPVIKSWKITCIGRYEGTRFEWKIRILCEHLLIWQLFVQNNISYEKREKWPTYPQSPWRFMHFLKHVIRENMPSA